MACSGTYNLTVRSYPDDDLRAVIDYLSAIDFAAKHADFLHRRQIGTGEWLVSDPIFQHLLVGKDRVLWCSGLRKAPQIVLILHIYKEEELHTPQNMIGSLLKQIIQHTKELNEDTRKLYANGQQKGARPELNELTRIVIKQAQNFSDVFLVVDALDECSELEMRRSKLLNEIEKLPSNVRMLFTSRHFHKLHERFKNVPHIDIRATNEDIKRYVAARFDTEMCLAGRAISNTLKDEIIDTVVAKSQGMCVLYTPHPLLICWLRLMLECTNRFLLAQMHLDSLSKKLTVRQVRSALAILPRELDDTYNQAMERIGGQDKGRATLAHRVLPLIVRTLRPVQTEELRHALAIEPSDEDLDEDGLRDMGQLVSACAGLVTVDEDSDQISLVHYTTQDYFERICMALLQVSPLNNR